MTRTSHKTDQPKPTTRMRRTRRFNNHSSPVKLCKCGCGTAVAPGRTWVAGHNNRGKNNIMYGRKNPNAGRHSTYQSYRCRELLEHMRTGMSRLEAAHKMGLWDGTLKKWARDFPEFAEAMERGRELEEAWWREKGRANVDNNKFNHGLYIYMTANKFGWSRTDKLQIQQSGELKHEHTHTGQVKLDAGDIGNVTAVLNILVQSGAIRAISEGQPLITQGADTENNEVLPAHSNP